MKKKNIILILIIVIIVAFISVITYYKFNHEKEYIIIDIKDTYRKVDEIDLSKYEEEINHTDIEFPYEFQIFEKEYDFSGSIDIKDNDLYITDTYIDETNKIFDDVRNIMLIQPDEENYLIIYAITLNNDLYKIYFDGWLDDIKIEKVNNNIKVKSFTMIKYYVYHSIDNPDIIVLSVDDKLYYMPSEFLYEEGILNVDNEYIVYSDSAVATYDGKLLKDENEKEIKAQIIFSIMSEEDIFEGNPHNVILTDDYRLVYAINDKLYIYNKEVTNTYYDDEIADKIIIEFSDGSKKEFIAIIDWDYVETEDT